MGEPVGMAGHGPAGDADRVAEDPGAVVRAAIAGDEGAWVELLDLYTRRVFAMARSRIRDDEMAEEITQSVFVTVAEKLRSGSYRDEGRFEAWLFRIVMNRVRDEIRRRKRSYVGSDTDAIERERGGDDGDSDIADASAALHRAIATLPEADQEIIALRHQSQMSFKDIAALLEEPVGTLLARHHRALRKLRGLLESPESTVGKETA